MSSAARSSGNNNVYCQDNELVLDRLGPTPTRDLIEFTRTVSALRAAHPVFRRRRFFSGTPGAAGAASRPARHRVVRSRWLRDDRRGLGVRLRQVGRGVPQRHGIPDLDVRGQRITDDSFVLCFNAHFEPIDFTLPKKKFGASWVPVIYTADDVNDESKPYDAGAKVTVDSRSVMVLQAASLDDVVERVAVLRRPVDLAALAAVHLRIKAIDFVVGLETVSLHPSRRRRADRCPLA